MSQQDLESVKHLIAFLQPALPTTRQEGPAYRHLGALVADVALQSAINYENVVRPRVNAILCKFSTAASASSLICILIDLRTEDLLQWRGAAKVAIFENILSVLVESNIETVEECADWIVTAEATKKLSLIDGIGKKSLDYFQLLCGHPTFPLDRHIYRFLDLAGVDHRRYSYDSAKQLLLDSCYELDLDVHATERGLWDLMRSCV